MRTEEEILNEAYPYTRIGRLRVWLASIILGKKNYRWFIKRVLQLNDKDGVK